MDSISTPEEVPPVLYCISGRPTLPHHIKTLLNAEKELGQPVTLAIVVNILKKDQMFSVEEGVVLAKQLAAYMNVSPVRIIGIETKEKVAMCFQEAEIIVRRKEQGLDSDSEYIQRAAAVHDAPALPGKIKWIDSGADPQHTAGRFKSLLYVAEHHPKERVRNICLSCAQKIAPDFMIEAVQKKLRAQPDRQFFLSITPDLQPFFDTIKKNSEI